MATIDPEGEEELTRMTEVHAKKHSCDGNCYPLDDISPWKDSSKLDIVKELLGGDCERKTYMKERKQ